MGKASRASAKMTRCRVRRQCSVGSPLTSSFGINTPAHAAQADALFDDILTIADDGQNDWMEKKNADGKNIGWMENGEALRRSALRIDARKWMAGKLRPKVYGDKLDVSVDGKVDFVIGAKPVTEADWLKEHGSKS